MQSNLIPPPTEFFVFVRFRSGYSLISFRVPFFPAGGLCDMAATATALVPVVGQY
jgi:hypothetical protein